MMKKNAKYIVKIYVTLVNANCTIKLIIYYRSKKLTHIIIHTKINTKTSVS